MGVSTPPLGRDGGVFSYFCTPSRQNSRFGAVQIAIIKTTGITSAGMNDICHNVSQSCPIFVEWTHVPGVRHSQGTKFLDENRIIL